MRPADKDTWIEDAMASIDGIERAHTNIPVYDMVMQKVYSAKGKVVTMSPRMALRAAACIVVLIAVNVYVCMQYSVHKNGTSYSNINEKAVAKEYFSFVETYSF